MGSKRIAALAFVSITFASVPSFAQSLADKETARAQMDEGDAKREKQDYKGALAAYEKADAIMHVPTTGLEVARMQAQLGMLLEARETLSRVVRLPAKPNEPAAFVNARKAADQLNDELAKRVPAVQLVISGVDAGQVPEVTIDNEPLPAAVLNVPRKVNPGTHMVVVKAGSAEKKTEVVVAEKETKTVNIDLKDKPAEKPEPVKSDTGDGERQTRILMFGGFGLAIVGIGVGAVTGFMSMSKVDEIKNDCRDDKCPASRATDIDDAKSLGNISTIAFAAGAVGAAVGVVGLIMMSGSKSESPPAGSTAHAQTTLKTRPILSPAFLGLSGTF